MIPTLPGGQLQIHTAVEAEMQRALEQAAAATEAVGLRSALKSLQGVVKNLELDRKETMAPYRGAVEAIQEFYRGLAGRLDAAMADVKGKLLAIVQAAEQAERERAAAEAAAHVEERPTAPLLPRSAAEIRPPVSTYTHTSAVVTDLGLLPREYLVPDLPKIKAALEAGLAVPGAHLHTETRIAAR